MTKTMTKVLSFVLALALVAAFVPAGVISNADAATLNWAGAENTTVYNLAINASQSSGAGIKIGTLTDYNQQGNTNWYDSESYGIVYHASGYRKGHYASGTAFYATDSASGLYALTVKLPDAPGKYLLSADLLNYSNLGATSFGGTSVNVYMWPKNAETTGNVKNMMTSQYLVNDVDRTRELDDSLTKTKMGTYTHSTYNLAVIEITQDMAGKEYILGFNADTYERAQTTWVGYYGIGINKITLNGAGAEVLSDVSLTSSGNMLSVGSSKQLNLTAKLSDGSDATEATVSYVSDSTDIIVSDTGLVTANAEGIAKITAIVTLDTIIKKESVTITAGNPDAFAGAGATVEYNYAASRFGGPKAYQDNEDYKAANNGASRSALLYNYFPVDPAEQDYTDGNGATAAKIFKFHSMSDGNLYCMNTGATPAARFGLDDLSGNGWLAVTVKLPSKAGRYTAQFNYLDWLGGAKQVAFYILPAETDNVGEALETASPVGTVNIVTNEMHGTITYDYRTANFGTYKLDASLADKEAIFVIKTIGTTGIAGGVGLYGVNFKGITLNGLENPEAENELNADAFDIAASSGFYAADINAEPTSGAIAFSALFKAYASYADSIDSYGIYVYRQDATGTQIYQNRIPMSSTDASALVAADGAFSVVVNEITTEHFDSKVIAMPYVVIDGITYFGKLIAADVDELAYLGAE